MKTAAVMLMVLLSLVERMLAAPVVPKNDQFVAKCRAHCSKAVSLCPWAPGNFFDRFMMILRLEWWCDCLMFDVAVTNC